jgi:pimeloyl-ACP methyl ester carboxylesterase
MEKEIIKTEYKSITIVADIIPARSQPQVLLLHGAGASNRLIYEAIRKELAQNNISSYALDFLGYGDTGGNLNDSSLKSRTEQVQAVIEKANVVKPLVVVAGSMAAYNAIKLTEIYPVSLLVLSAPGLYRPDVYEVNFGNNFSALIREPKSWDKTDAWEILNKYKGNLIVLKGGKDEVIPVEIPQKIYDSAINVNYREVITFPDAPHRIMNDYLPQHLEDLKRVVDKIIELMK